MWVNQVVLIFAPMLFRNITAILLAFILLLPFAALHFVDSPDDDTAVTSLIEDLSEEEEDGEGVGKSNFGEPLLVREHFYVFVAYKRLEDLTLIEFKELNLISKVIHLENSTPPPELV